MSGTKRYSPELRERAVRMVMERREEFSSEWAAVSSISKLLGMTAETLRTWLRRAQVDGGLRPGLSADERAKIKELEWENRDLRRANEILKAASVFFATELDGRTKR
jgi:transposase